ncbi:MAG: TIGR00300 family protein [Archaeoglobaceae archaeon]
MAVTKELEFEGHLIDSMIFPKVLDAILDMDGEFDIQEFTVGKKKKDYSYARLLVFGQDDQQLNKIMGELHKYGAKIPEPEEVDVEEAPADKVLPEGFYVTTNHPTLVNYGGDWLPVQYIGMDRTIAIRNGEAFCVSVDEVQKGDLIVLGEKGVRVSPPERPRESSRFQFMTGSVSSERPTDEMVGIIAEEIVSLKKQGGKIAVVAGPAIDHSGARNALAGMIREGYIDLMLTGNALAVHDIELSIFHTSLGMDIKTGRPVPRGNRHHIYTVSKIIGIGSIKKAIEDGIITDGIMYECYQTGTPFILAGSIRDDGPLPEVITDVMEAKREMKKALKDMDMVIMCASMLHSIAIGNLLPSTVKTICVDMNPATVTKLMDRGSAQAIGVVSDVGLFVPQLYQKLKEKE